MLYVLGALHYYTYIHTAPGPLQSVNYEPDILSVLLTWEPPLRGRGYITMVTLEYYNSGGVKLGTESVVGSSTSYRCSVVLCVCVFALATPIHSLSVHTISTNTQ